MRKVGLNTEIPLKVVLTMPPPIFETTTTLMIPPCNFSGLIIAWSHRIDVARAKRGVLEAQDECINLYTVK
jgi:hypothetical protein